MLKRNKLPSQLPVQEEFMNALYIIVTKKKVVELTVEEGWYSESELKDEFGWSQFLAYISCFYVHCMNPSISE